MHLLTNGDDSEHRKRGRDIILVMIFMLHDVLIRLKQVLTLISNISAISNIIVITVPAAVMISYIIDVINFFVEFCLDLLLSLFAVYHTNALMHHLY